MFIKRVTYLNLVNNGTDSVTMKRAKTFFSDQYTKFRQNIVP